MHALIMPADACSVTTSPGTQETYSVKTAWTFETAMTWSEYSRWVAARLQPSYVLLQTDSDSHLEFIKHLPNDSCSLRLEPDDLNLRRIRVEFVAVAK